MQNFYPSYYTVFRCIAADCPDSCCQGWDVVIDSDTEARYEKVGGDIGGRLREAIYTDDDGDRVFHLREGKKCPFWGDDKLCDIYRELGEEYLCGTCAQFPRLRMEFADFTEHSLALACPEAARLILQTDRAYDDFVINQPTGCEDYSAELMRTLTTARRRIAAVLSNDLSLHGRLTEALLFAYRIQEEIAHADSSANADKHTLTDLYSSLEYIEERNREAITGCRPNADDLSDHETELARLALYYLYRYFLTAVDTLDVLTPIKLMISSVLMIAALSKRETITLEEAAQRFSKETEQSYENMELLYDGLAQIPIGYFENILLP